MLRVPHSINFGNKNTWDDWHLAPSSRPLFNPPSVKTKIVDIPGANGSLDLTEALTGLPVYENRSGTIEFYVMNDYWEWYDAYSTIMNYLHGRTMMAVLEDDPMYYYKGRFSVNSWNSDKDYSKISIDYSVDPFKYMLVSTDSKWLWNPFNFETDYIMDSTFGDIEIGNLDTINLQFDQSQYGYAAVCPIFSVKGGPLKLEFNNDLMGVHETRTLNEGENRITDFLLYGPSISLKVTNEADSISKLSIIFNKGIL